MAAAPVAVAPNTAIVNRKFFNLDTFTSVKVSKSVAIPPEFNSVETAIASFGNDTTKLLAALNRLARVDAKREAKGDPDGWLVTNDGVTSVYNGVAIDEKKVRKTINDLAISICGMNSARDGGDSADVKKAKRAEAAEMLRSNPKMLAGLKEHCVISVEDDDDDSPDDES